jgi:hypothetical protein
VANAQEVQQAQDAQEHQRHEHRVPAVARPAAAQGPSDLAGLDGDVDADEQHANHQQGPRRGAEIAGDQVPAQRPDQGDQPQDQDRKADSLEPGCH